MLTVSYKRLCNDVVRRASRLLRYSSRAHSSGFSTFVSKHYNFDPAELKNVIDSMHTETRQKEEGGPIEVKECKLCNKRNRSNADNIWKLNIRPDGSYYCYRCAASGSYYDLKKKTAQKFGYSSAGDCLDGKSTAGSEEDLEGVEEVSTKKTTTVKKAGKNTMIIENNEKKYVLPNQKTVVSDHYRLFPVEGEPDTQDPTVLAQRATVLEYLNNVRGLNNETLKRYGVGFTMQQFLSDESGDWEDQLCISFPWMISDEEVTPNRAGVSKKKPAKASTATVAASADTADVSCEVAVAASASAAPSSVSATHTSHLTIEGVKCVVVRSKYRALATKGLQRISPKGGQWGFFGWHLVNPPTTTTSSSSSSDSIIITEGEYDAMAVAQALSDLRNGSSSSSGGGGAVADSALSSIPVVSLPNGCNSLPVELVALLEPFSRIYLWLDNDKSGIDACEKFVKKLGVLRCVVVRPEATDKNPPKDANDALRRANGSSLIVDLLRKAKLMKHSKIQTFADLRDEVFAAIRRVDEREGTQTQSLSKLCQICKGFRKGELVVFSGPTGSGKTTLLSQLSLDFAKEGAATLWGSFEIKNNRLIHKMLQQSYKHGALNLLSDTKLHQVANDFEALPLLFMNFHGSTAIDEIIDAMDYSVYKDDIQHIIIDNLQFMMPRGTARGNFDKYDYQDSVIDKFRRFATEKNVNVILVIHPRKEDDAVPLGMSSIFGSAKATQEADIVMLLQRSGDSKMSLDIKKNRYDGTLGKVQLDFNPMSMCYVESDRVDTSNSLATAASGGGFKKKAM